MNEENHWQQVELGTDPPIRTWVSPPTRRFVATTDGHTIRLVKTEDTRIRHVYSVERRRRLAVFPAASCVAVVGRDDGTVRIYDVATGIHRRELGSEGIKRSRTSHIPDATHLAATLGAERAVPLWKLDDNPVRPIELAANDACEVGFARDGKSLTVTSTNGSHRIFATTSGQLLRKVDFDKPAPTALSPDGQTLAWVEGRLLHRLDTATRKERPLAPGHSGTVRRLAFAGDGKA